MPTTRHTCGLCQALGLVLYVWYVAGLLPGVALARPTERVLYVDMHHPLAADDNPGTLDLPYRTITRAAQQASANAAQHLGSRISIFPGVYREAITLERPARDPGAPIMFAAHVPGSVIISGSDVWSGWTRRGDGRVYTHPWPYTWGLSAHPWEQEQITLEPITRRREMLFVQGQALTQVLSREALQDGSFYVSEAERLVYLAWPAAVDLTTLTIEVAAREYLFSARQISQVSLSGLRFQHAASRLQDSAVRFTEATHVTVQDCQFLWNNWAGLGFWDVAHLLVTSNSANHNGGLGMLAWKTHDVLFADNETSYNNWRGAQGHFYGWAVAGLKMLRQHQAVYRQHRAVGNHARGFWLDYDNADITIERATVCDNALDGMFIEASQGPVLIKQSTFCRNARGAGLLSTNSRAVTLDGNVLYDNGGPQLKITGRSERRVENWQTGAAFFLRAEDWLLQGNTFMERRTGQPLVEVPQWPHFLRRLSSVYNLWSHPVPTRAFKVGQQHLGFAAWNNTLRQESGSRFATPDTIGLHRPGVSTTTPLLSP